MKRNTLTTYITPFEGNIFADMGFEPDEAKALLTDADQRISEKIAIKESLMSEISEWIDEKKLKQVEAAKILGISGRSSPKVAVNFLPEKGNSSIIQRPKGGKGF